MDVSCLMICIYAKESIGWTWGFGLFWVFLMSGNNDVTKDLIWLDKFEES